LTPLVAGRAKTADVRIATLQKSSEQLTCCAVISNLTVFCKSGSILEVAPALHATQYKTAAKFSFADSWNKFET
jgi:hypothetical protein